MNVLNTIFPRARAEIFKILFSEDLPELHMREIVRRSELNLRTIQRELSTLAESELITTRKDGNRQCFRANSEHSIFKEICSIVLKEGSLKILLTKALKNVDGIRFAFIYGSIAKGENKLGSDIDLFVIGEVGLRKIVNALRPVREKIDREINPYNLSIEDWVKRLTSDDAFTNSVAQKEKIFIIGDAHEFERLA